MNYYGGKELAAAFRTVRRTRFRSRRTFPKSKYDFKPSPEIAVIGQTLVHIAVGHDVSDDSQRADSDLRRSTSRSCMKKFGAEEAKPRTRPRSSRC